MLMRVQFIKMAEGRLCAWVAAPPKRRPFLGSTMNSGRDLPHDLSQFTIERALDIRDGFWGLLAHGGCFASVPGRRTTNEGRAVVRRHRDALMHVEHVVNGHYSAWHSGKPTPLTPHLDAMLGRWRALAEGEALELEWDVRSMPGEPHTPTSKFANRTAKMRRVSKTH